VLLNWEGGTGAATTQNIEQRQTAVRISTARTERVECPIALGEQVRRPAPDRRVGDTLDAGRLMAPNARYVRPAQASISAARPLGIATRNHRDSASDGDRVRPKRYAALSRS
jgi:hypothetical protein